MEQVSHTLLALRKAGQVVGQALTLEGALHLAQALGYRAYIAWTEPLTANGEVVGYRARAEVRDDQDRLVSAGEAQSVGADEVPSQRLRTAQDRALALALRYAVGPALLLNGLSPEPVFGAEEPAPAGPVAVEPADGEVAMEPDPFRPLWARLHKAREALGWGREEVLSWATRHYKKRLRDMEPEELEVVVRDLEALASRQTRR